MALTALRRHSGTIGNLILTIADVTFDSSYPTGGELLPASKLGLRQVFGVIASGTGAEVAVWDRDTEKLKLFTADGVEAVNLSDQDAVTVTVIAFGN